MKKTGIIILIGLFLFALSCKLTKTGKTKLVSFNSDQFCDSLKRSGVDTFLVFRKQCVECNSYMNETPQKHFSLPVYIFWVKKGRYFVTKADQQGKYKTVERLFRNHWPIYDFWNRNQQQIKTNDRITRKNGDDFITVIDHLDRKSETDQTEIIISISGTSDKIINDQFIVMPITQVIDSVLALNSKVTYYQNLLLPRYEWERIIEAELFELEFKKLWED